MREASRPKRYLSAYDLPLPGMPAVNIANDGLALVILRAPLLRAPRSALRCSAALEPHSALQLVVRISVHRRRSLHRQDS